MKEFTQFFGFTFFIGIIFIIVGIIMFYFPPRKINGIYGYRTPASMKSPERWHFAQRYSAIRLMITGAITMLFSLLIHILELNDDIELAAELALVLFAVLYLIIGTESAIKKRFPNNVG